VYFDIIEVKTNKTDRRPRDPFAKKTTMPRDPYEILGVSKSASDEEIKKSYRKLARDFHPDRNPGDKGAEAQFKEVQDAYDLLTDKEKKTRYDQFGFAGPNMGGGPGGGFHFGDGANIDPAQFEDILSSFMGGAGSGGGFGFGGGTKRARGGRSRRREPAPAYEHDLPVPFLTTALGGKVGLDVNGKQIDIRIPAGVEEGKVLRVPGQAPGGGDLHLKIRVENHSFFRRDGNDVSLEVPISVTEAILGTKVDVPLLDATQVSLKIPPGTSSGPRRLRLRGKGINGGDQYIDIKIVAAAPASDKARELLEEFAREQPISPRADVPWAK